MTRHAPLSRGLPEAVAADVRLHESGKTDESAAPAVKESSREMLERRLRQNGPEAAPGLWKGTREGLIATVIAVAAALVFGGAAGDWFSPDEHGRLGQFFKMAGGTMLMAAAVCLSGSLVSGRNPVFWGIGMPLLVYGAGAFCAFVTGGHGVAMFLLGAPLFCGLAILSGVICAYLVDRD